MRQVAEFLEINPEIDATAVHDLIVVGAGPADAFEVEDETFTTRSLRGSAVLRWEWRPGSTLFLVWQQFRSGAEPFGDFRFGRDVRGVFERRPENVVAVKATYWNAPVTAGQGPGARGW